MQIGTQGGLARDRCLTQEYEVIRKGIRADQLG
jgi:hypothetical protein